ncbi:MAG: C25 family peptidase propeptide domain-containing protein, partial [Candidatus Cloacimonetes bacterium]|nr:C25 family peptidase propeptide domain-containing protein [Candidatus Cloacimonadota bacterium]
MCITRKRLLILLLAMLLISTFSFAANARKVSFSNLGNQSHLLNNNDYGFELQFKLQDYSLEEIQTKAGNFDQISIDGFGFSGRIGEPKLPVYSKLIAVPVGANVQFE